MQISATGIWSKSVKGLSNSCSQGNFRQEIRSTVLPDSRINFREERGFTLLELLAVVAIIAVTLGFAVLPFNLHDPDSEARIEAERMTALLRIAGEEAVLGSRELAFELSPDGYEFLRLVDNNWETIEDDPVFRVRSIPAEVEIKIGVEDEIVIATAQQESSYPRIYLLSSGEMTAFEMTLRSIHSNNEFRITGNESGEVTYHAPLQQ